MTLSLGRFPITAVDPADDRLTAHVPSPGLCTRITERPEDAELSAYIDAMRLAETELPASPWCPSPGDPLFGLQSVLEALELAQEHVAPWYRPARATDPPWAVEKTLRGLSVVRIWPPQSPGVKPWPDPPCPESHSSRLPTRSCARSARHGRRRT
jgi:hypothetical protein